MKAIEEEGKGGEERRGGKSLCSHLPLCQQLVTVATSKKSLIYTVAGSGVFNCIISSSFFFPPPVSSFLLVCCVPFF